MLSFQTRGYNGYSCKYSPFYDNKLAVSTSANFGLVGNGRLYILNINNDGSITQETIFDTQDGLFDTAWSELHENQLIACSGDGAVSLFDMTLPSFPIMRWKEHVREVYSVNWNLINKSIFCSSSWDGSIKVWNPQTGSSISTFTSPKDVSLKVDHSQPIPIGSKPTPNNQTSDCVYQAIFSPHDPNVIASVNSASHTQFWDLRSSDPLVLDFVAHRGMEILTLDYNKYRPMVIATGSVDKTIKVWDIRKIPNLRKQHISNHADKVGATPINNLVGHDFAVKKVSWSPYESDRLISAGYDMTVKVWRDMTDEKTNLIESRRLRNSAALLTNFTNHKEFVMGCDWSLWAKGYVASVSWDEMVYVWRA